MILNEKIEGGEMKELKRNEAFNTCSHSVSMFNHVQPY